MLLALGWIAIALIGALAVTQVVGYGTSRVVAIPQSFTPWALLAAFPIGLAALIAGEFALAALTLLPLIYLGVLVRSVRTRTDRGSYAGRSVRVAHSNLLFTNERHAPAAMQTLVDTDADILVLNEFTHVHEAALLAALQAAQRDSDYPHRIGRAEYGPHGIGVWSRFPLSEPVVLPSDTRLGLLTTVDVDGLPVQLLAAHPPPPIRSAGRRDWIDGLLRIEEVAGSPTGRTIIIGDFNAARWHPPFRRLLDVGWRCAHEDVGRGFGSTWPTDRLYFPPFVRLDHALLGSLVRTVSVVDLPIPGSDHHGGVFNLTLID
jgi:endonuclease/exonuclease/phosphatase (EEP) superfamily protein YafD